MVPVTVVVAFYSRCGSSETLALQAAVGAVQARALIRMRRVPDVDVEARSGEDATCRDEFARMRREYVPPTEGDLLGAEGLIVAATKGSTPRSPEWAPLVALLTKLGAEGKLRGKVAAIVNGGDTVTVQAFATFFHDCGLLLVPPSAVAPSGDDREGVERARVQGRFVADLGRAVKASSMV